MCCDILTMKSVSVLLVFVVTAILGLELNEAATLLNEIQEEINTIDTSKYSRKGLTDTLDALMKASRDLETTKSELQAKMKYFEQIKQDIDLVDYFKKGLDAMLNNLNPDNKTLSTTNATSALSMKKKYVISTDQVSWYAARERCIEKEMKFASIESEEDQRELEETIESLGYSVDGVWVGAANTALDGQFVWVSSGRPLSYTNWHNSQPDEGNPVCLDVYSRNGYTWYDDKCGDGYHYACEYYK